MGNTDESFGCPYVGLSPAGAAKIQARVLSDVCRALCEHVHLFTDNATCDCLQTLLLPVTMRDGLQPRRCHASDAVGDKWAPYGEPSHFAERRTCWFGS